VGPGGVLVAPQDCLKSHPRSVRTCSKKNGEEEKHKTTNRQQTQTHHHRQTKENKTNKDVQSCSAQRLPVQRFPETLSRMPLHRSVFQILLTFRFCNPARSRQKQWKLSFRRRPLAAVSVGVWAWHTSYTHRPTRDDGCNIFCGTDGNGGACGPKGRFNPSQAVPQNMLHPKSPSGGQH
jgi:hypothetical protein